MGMFSNDRVKARKFRQARVRKQLRGTSHRPRLSVFRSEKHIYAQVIADETGETHPRDVDADAGGAGSAPEDDRRRRRQGASASSSRKSCLEKGITAVVFDRNGFLYHGRVRAVAEGAREAGLKF